MYKQARSSIFPRDYKKCLKKHWNMDQLEKAMLAVVKSDKTPLAQAYNDHGLTGDKQGYRLLHIDGRTSDWLLYYKIIGDTVYFVRTGSHDDILK